MCARVFFYNVRERMKKKMRIVCFIYCMRFVCCLCVDKANQVIPNKCLLEVEMVVYMEKNMSLLSCSCMRTTKRC